MGNLDLSRRNHSLEKKEKKARKNELEREGEVEMAWDGFGLYL